MSLSFPLHSVICLCPSENRHTSVLEISSCGGTYGSVINEICLLFPLFIKYQMRKGILLKTRYTKEDLETKLSFFYKQKVIVVLMSRLSGLQTSCWMKLVLPPCLYHYIRVCLWLSACFGQMLSDKIVTGIMYST